jgi:hypothetical protein
MMRRVYFKEEQRFTQVWLWVVLIVTAVGAILPVVVALYAQLVEGRQFGENPSSNVTLLITFFIVLGFSVGVILLFWKTRLITVVDNQAIQVRFPPFFLKARVFSADTIKEYRIRKYKPILEYGGWGIRFGLGRKGKAYNVKGNTGLQLVFKDDKHLLIGTQRSDALYRAMKKMMKGGKDA